MKVREGESKHGRPQRELRTLMLFVTRYPRAYVNDCRTLIRAQLAAYRTLVKKAGTEAKTIAEFDRLFFSHLVLALDLYFVHRGRGQELKDGNPLNEVRMFCTSILEHGGTLVADTTIEYNPAHAVLKRRIGDAINLSEPEFVQLSDAFFADLERKFT